MALSQKLNLKQSQHLAMTPQLQQSIKLLQFSSLELQAHVDAEVERNPFLEVESGSEATENNIPEKKEDETPNAADDLLAGRVDPNETDGQVDADFSDAVFNNDTISDSPSPGPSVQDISFSSGWDGDFDAIERLSEEATLSDYLHAQLSLIPLESKIRLIASHLIDLVDENGYILEGLNSACDTLACSMEEIEQALQVVQGMDPPGVGARNLAECMAIQLREKDRFDPCMQTLVNNLDLLGRRNYPALKKMCRVNTEELQDMISEIQALNPRPGATFSAEKPVESVQPDVFVKKNEQGIWTVELNTESLPRVLINQAYYKELTSLKGASKDKDFISECFQSANWLQKALDQRARTILKVASELVRQQEAFFEKGVRFLRPLTLKSIADKIDMHESTVSRVTNNKYIATARGLYEMKYFFTTAIANSTGTDAHSSESVRARIKELIDSESPKAILSDDKLVALLKNEGMDIARRTVAKYRESMHIPSSVDRRRQKNSQF